jgi:hypothetical protein
MDMTLLSLSLSLSLSLLLLYIDKCHTFAIKKTHSSSSQFLPYLTLGGERVPPVEIGESFDYLGKVFSFDMKSQHVKDKLLAVMEDIIEKTDLLPLHPRSKISIVTVYMYSKISWFLSCYHLDLNQARSWPSISGGGTAERM